MNPKAAFLDRRLEGTSLGVAMVASASSTTYTLPYAVAVDGSEGELIVVRQDTGQILSSSRPAPNQIRADGNLTGVPVYIGILYDFLYIPTRIYLRSEGGTPEQTGRLQLRYLDVRYSESTDLSVTVGSTGRSDHMQVIDIPEPDTGFLHLPVMAQNTQTSLTISDRSPGALRVVGLDWEGFISTRAKRQG